MDSTQIFASLAQVEDAALHEEVFGLLEAARNFSHDCAPSDEYEASFILQITTHLSKYSPDCVSWFSSQGITAAS
jgi:hypothetical protein